MQTFGKYEVLREIGAGGFGKVYEGRDPVLKRRVAIKTCPSDDREMRIRFEREALIVAALQHPNITTIHDLGSQDGVPYLVQEYLSGEDLSEVIARREPLPLEERLRILLGVATALEHAHRQGIVHRDVKPGNIRILDDGSVKVMDFGIAKLASLETKITRTGTLLGTAGYLSPEQIGDREVDHRCDIFSFGVVAYELLTHQRPFAGSTISALLYQILHTPHRSLRAVWPEAPDPLVALVDRCLQKEPDQRPESFTIIREELANLTGAAAPATSRARGTPKALVARSAVEAGTASPSLATDETRIQTPPSAKSAQALVAPAMLVPSVAVAPAEGAPSLGRVPGNAWDWPRWVLLATALLVPAILAAWWLFGDRDSTFDATATSTPAGIASPAVELPSAIDQPGEEAITNRDPQRAQLAQAIPDEAPPAATDATDAVADEPADDPGPPATVALENSEPVERVLTEDEPQPPGTLTDTLSDSERRARTEAQVRKLLSDYEDAANRRDLRAMRRLWPTMPQNAARIVLGPSDAPPARIDIAGCAIEIAGPLAKAICNVERERTVAGSRIEHSGQRIFHLRRNGLRLVIVRVE
jgi:tRNA A-37 threonylcarbamoyl transferase component Bud32